MNTKLKFFVVLTVVSLLVISCGGAAPAPTEAPAVTEAPAEGLAATEAPAEGPAATEAPAEEICSLTPDGVGQSFTSREVSTEELGAKHGKYVYTDVLNQINESREFTPLLVGDDAFPGNLNLSSPAANPPSITDLVVILVVDMFSPPNPGEMSSAMDFNTFVRRIDLFVNDKGQGLLTVAVDTNGLNYDVISNNIPAAIDYFSANDAQLGEYSWAAATRIVVNMSFVFVPCKPENFLDNNLRELQQNDFVKGNYNTVEDLNNAYQPGTDLYEQVNNFPPLQSLRSRWSGLESTERDNATFQALTVRLLYDPAIKRSWQYSPFQDLNQIECKSDNGGLYNIMCDYFYNKELEIVYVGAAGNSGYDYPFAPASWDFVDSISSIKGEKDPNPHSVHGISLAGYSNSGEIRDDGMYRDPVDNTIFKNGTSFAAPKFSYKIAHYILVDGGSSLCSKSLPALGYAAAKDPSFFDSSGNPISDNDMTFSDAMAKYCP